MSQGSPPTRDSGSECMTLRWLTLQPKLQRDMKAPSVLTTVALCSPYLHDAPTSAEHQVTDHVPCNQVNHALALASAPPSQLPAQHQGRTEVGFLENALIVEK